MSSPLITAATSTFRFRRYREEVALRSSLQQRTTDNTENKNKASADAIAIAEHDISATNEAENDNGDGDGDDGTVIQNLSNVIIVVDLYGKVLTEKKTSDTQIIELITDQSDNKSILAENDETDNAKQREEPICVVPEGTTLLLRNLRDCHVIIHLPLPAVHFADIENTEIVFFNKSKVGSSNNILIHDNESNANAYANTTIHMTDCRGTSSLQLETSAQQLRIHRAIGLRVKSPCDWKPGTIILEASKDIVFSVPPLVEAAAATTPTSTTANNQSQNEGEQEASSTATTVATTKTYWHQVIVKDFQWLRKGIASPNFQIEVLMASSSSTEDSADILERTRNLDLEELECGNSSDSEDEL